MSDSVCQVGQKCTKHFWFTGYDGSDVWQFIHNQLLKKINCAECADHAGFEFRGLHDHINAGLRKPIFDAKTYEAWVKEINQTFDLWKRGYNGLD